MAYNILNIAYYQVCKEDTLGIARTLFTESTNLFDLCTIPVLSYKYLPTSSTLLLNISHLDFCDTQN